jgi:phosphatidylinositol-3-phosphatase
LHWRLFYSPAKGESLPCGTQVGLNPGLAAQADTTVEKIVSSITGSPAWNDGNNAIVIVWDENDYSGIANAQPAKSLFPVQNQNVVVLTVQTNSKDKHSTGATSGTFYNSYSLLKSLEAAFRLPCLNHACDANVKVMSGLFGSDHDSDHGHW